MSPRAPRRVSSLKPYPLSHDRPRLRRLPRFVFVAVARFGLAAARHRLRPLAVVCDDLVPADDLRHIITDNIQILELRDLGLLVAIRCGSVADREEIALVDGVSLGDGHAHELA